MAKNKKSAHKSVTKVEQSQVVESPQPSSQPSLQTDPSAGYVITGEQLQQLRQLLGAIVQTGSGFNPDPVKMYTGMIQANQSLATQAADVLQKLEPVV